MQNNKLNYQQAKKLRKQSLSSVIADQLILGEGYTSSVTKSISLKTKAKITGFKEKFDPLNIAKFITGGSRLGTALAGKMLGRSRKDIEYFAGRARVVGQREKKIGALPSERSNSSGVVSVLNDINTFLHKQHEDNMVSREKENNLREGQQHGDEKRHRALLVALENIGAKPATATKVGPKKGLFDSFLEWLYEKFDWLKKFDEWGPKLLAFMELPIITWLVAFGTVAALVVGLSELLAFGVKKVDNRNVITPQQAADMLKPGSGADREIEKFPGGREALFKIASQGHIDAKSILDSKDENKIRDAGGKDFLEKVVASGPASPPPKEVALTKDLSQYSEQKGPKRPVTGGTSLPKKQEDWDNKWSKIYEPVTGKRLDLVSPKQEETKPVSPAKPATPVAPPPVVPVTPKSAAVSVKTQENKSLGLESKVTPKSQTTNLTQLNTTKTQKRAIVVPTVRNQEETFQRMILNSTRVV